MLKQFLFGIKNIMTLRVGPQGLPYSPTVVISLIVLTLGASYFLSDIQAVFAMVISLAVTISCLWLGLFYTKKQERFIQTLTAMILTSCIMTLLVLALWYGSVLIAAITGGLQGVNIHSFGDIVNMKVEKDTMPMGLSMLFVFGLLVLAIWKFLIDIFIVRQSFECRAAIAVAFLLVIYLLPGFMNMGIWGYTEPHSTTPATAITSPPSTSPPASGSQPVEKVIQINS